MILIFDATNILLCIIAIVIITHVHIQLQRMQEIIEHLYLPLPLGSFLSVEVWEKLVNVHS